MKVKFLTIPAALVLFASCNIEVHEPQLYGELSVSLSDEPVVELLTKEPTTLDQSSADAENYTVSIFDSSDKLKYSKTYDQFQIQTLPFGTYYVTAENMTADKAEEGDGQMRLYGRSADITLSSTQLTQTATVNCTVANAKVSVVYDESVAGRFDNLQVVLKGGTTSDRSFTISQTDTGVETVKWFNPSPLTYTITGTFNYSGVTKQVNISKSIVLNAKDNVRLLVKLNLESGQVLVPIITVDTTINKLTTIEEEFNPYE